MEREGESAAAPEADRDDDLVALEGLEAELADLDEDLARVDRDADEPADPLPGT